MHEALVAPCTSADTCWLRKAAHLRFPGVDLQYYRYIRGQHVVQVTCCCPCLSGDWKLPSTNAGHAHISGRQNFTLGVHAHYSDVIMSMMVSQIASVSIVCSPVCSGADQRKHQSSALLAFVRGILFLWGESTSDRWWWPLWGEPPVTGGTGLGEGNPLVTVGFSSQRASNAENVSIWWHHHASFLRHSSQAQQVLGLPIYQAQLNFGH